MEALPKTALRAGIREHGLARRVAIVGEQGRYLMLLPPEEGSAMRPAYTHHFSTPTGFYTGSGAQMLCPAIVEPRPRGATPPDVLIGLALLLDLILISLILRG